MTQFIALLISLIVEVTIILLSLRRLSSINFYWIVILACGATTLTHPIAWESNQLLIFYASFPLRSSIIESFVILAEAVIYCVVLKLQWKQSLFVSFIANLASFLVGLVILR